MAPSDEASWWDASEGDRGHHVADTCCVRWRTVRQRGGTWRPTRRRFSTADQHDCARSDHQAADHGGANDDDRRDHHDGRADHNRCSHHDSSGDNRASRDHHSGADYDGARLRSRARRGSAHRRGRGTTVTQGAARLDCAGHPAVDGRRLEVRPGHRIRCPPVPRVTGLGRRRRGRAEHPSSPQRSRRCSRRRTTSHHGVGRQEPNQVASGGHEQPIQSSERRSPSAEVKAQDDEGASGHRGVVATQRSAELAPLRGGRRP